MPYYWNRVAGQFTHSGTTPLAQNTLKLYSPITPGYSVRQRLQVELSVVAGGAGSGVAIGWWTEVVVFVGLWASSNVVDPTVSPLPYTDGSTPIRWLTNNALMADVQTYDQLTPAEVVRWRFDEETDQTKSKFSFPQGPYADVWLAWEIIDPNGIINSTIGGISYNLGGWYRLAALDHYT